MAINLGENSSHSLPLGTEMNQLSSNKMGSDLKRSLLELKTRSGALDSKKILDKNRLNKLRIDIITRVFATMKELGVDPGNLASINSFLQQLEQQDPDLLTLFEDAMAGIMDNNPQALSPAANQPRIPMAPGPEVAGVPAGGGGSGLMDKFKNLQQTMLRK